VDFVPEFKLRNMQAAVSADAGQEDQVAQRVIRAIPVAVMNYLARSQKAIQGLLCDKMMFMNISPSMNTLAFVILRREDADVSIGGNKAPAFPAS